MFSACFVYYLAAVYLVPSGPDTMHNVANWVIITAGLGQGPQMMAGMVVQWSGLHQGVSQSRRISCLLCVSSPTFEFGLGIETANEHGWESRAHGFAGKSCLLCQRELCGEQCWLRTQRPLLHGIVILRVLPTREIWPNERPLPQG